VAAERWQAVGLSAMLPTLVLTDGVGAAATPGGIDAPSSRRHLDEPEPVGAARYLLGAKDYLFGVLTGEVLTDPSTATGTGVYDLADGTWIAEAVPSGLPRLPEIAPSSTARPPRPDAARAPGLAAGTPVVLGSADSVLGALGLGLTSPGQVAYIAGTSTPCSQPEARTRGWPGCWQAATRRPFRLVGAAGGAA
jgi:xylulokinase